MIRVLLVEDRDEDARRLTDVIGTGAIAFDRAVSRHAAEDLLNSRVHYDLVICDLRIPAHDDGMDRIPVHGLAVQATASRVLPGTPVIFLTGVAEANIDELSAATAGGAVSDVFGDGRQLEMVRLFRKDRILACAQEVLDLADRIRAVEGVQIEGSATLRNSLGALDRRAIGFVARQWNGIRLELRAMGGGLSGGLTLHALVYDTAHLRASVFLKIDSLARCEQEKLRYDEFVLGTLSHSAFPSLTRLVQHALGDRACLVYKFADDWNSSLFGALSEGIDEAQTVGAVRGLLARWESMIETQRLSVRHLRRQEIDDEELVARVRATDPVHGEDLLERMREFENGVGFRVLFPQHGDLHGENVLYAPSIAPTLIDCGDVGMHLAGLDPFSLELSLLVHPGSGIRGEKWPSIDQARHWLDVDRYVESCPHADFVRSLREWALDVVDEAGFTAMAYAHLTRQLKYDGVPAATILAMIKAILV